MGDGVHVVLAVQNLQHAEVDACGAGIGGFQDDSDLVGWYPPDLPADEPGAVHLQVGVDACVAHADEQVLATAEYFVDDAARQIHGGELRYPNVAARECLTGERVSQLGRCAVDGVAFRHSLSDPFDDIRGNGSP